MDKENEVINGYEIIESMYVGENEVIIAENHNENGDKYIFAGIMKAMNFLQELTLYAHQILIPI